jgi:YD repeat-containing protein
MPEIRAFSANFVSGITAIDGGVSTFAYAGSSTVSIQTVNSRTTTLTLSSGDLVKVTNPDNGVHTFVDDGSHRLTQEQFGPNLENNDDYTSAGVLGTLTCGATPVNGVTTVSRTVPVPLAGVGLSTLATGDAMASSADPTGHVTRERFDPSGRVVQTVNAEGGVTRYEYTNGYLTKVTDPLGRVTSYTNDAQGYVTKLTLADGSVLTYASDATSFHNLTTFTNARGNSTTYAYDGSGQLTRVTDALSHATALGYSSGLLQTVTDALAHTTTYLYDASRRLSGTIDPLGGRTTITYDANGNLRTSSDELARVTTYANSVTGYLSAATDALNNVTSSVFDVAGLLQGVTDPLGAAVSKAYDSFKRGLVDSTVSAGAGLVLGALATVDAAGRQLATRDASGATASQTYSPAGR